MSAVKACAKVYVNERMQTNSAESVRALQKRANNGVYRHWSNLRMRDYVSAFAFRFNLGKDRNHTPVRLNRIIKNAVGKRLTHADLTAYSRASSSLRIVVCSCKVAD